MGCCDSSEEDERRSLTSQRSGGRQPLKQTASGRFKLISDRFKTIEDVQAGLREVGLESSNLIIGVDFTKSNTWTGKRTFGGRCLHEISQFQMNPYQQAIFTIGKTLEQFDDDKLIPAFGFGDSTTTGKSVFPFHPDGRPCFGFQEVLSRYNEITPHVQLAGPTNFTPLIEEAIKIVKESNNSYHILLIVADGQVSDPQRNADAIAKASSYPLSIIVVGVGDGPWDVMERFDDEIPQRKFDNLQFVSMSDMPQHSVNFDVSFSINALMEIPDQYQAIRELKLLG